MKEIITVKVVNGQKQYTRWTTEMAQAILQIFKNSYINM
jgi:hypothetical protein